MAVNTVTESPLTIWVGEDSPPNDRPVLLWDSFLTSDLHPASVSLPTYVEENSVQIRSKILRFFSEFKTIAVGDRPLELALTSHEGLSMWWMSSALMKRLGDPFIPFACRLIAIEEIVNKLDTAQIQVECPNREMRKAIQYALGHRVHLSSTTRRFLTNYLIGPMTATGSLARYLWHTRRLRLDQKVVDRNPAHQKVFIDYINQTPSSTQHKYPYVSAFWGRAATLVEDPMWYHVLAQNVSHRSVDDSLRSIEFLNQKQNAAHRLFLSRLSARDVLGALFEYVHNLNVHRRADRKIQNFRSSQSDIRLWWAFQQPWDKSMCGTASIRHLLLSRTTSQICAGFHRDSEVYYPLENQPWEIALTHHARRQGIRRLVGVAHSTVRFWDLRYFLDPSESQVMGSSILPGPDRILVNGTSSRDLLIENSFSSSKVKLVEALRYLYLLDVTRRVTDTVVILADFKESINARLLRLCSSALEKGALTSQIKVRSHPIFPLSSRHLGRLSDCLTTESLGELLGQASVVITTAASSSAADCVSLGIPTILVADPTSLNYSPFRMSPLVTTVSDVDQLLDALQRAKNDEQRDTSETFCLDPDLPRWREEFKN